MSNRSPAIVRRPRDLARVQDCTSMVCELVRYNLENVTLKGAWSGPAATELFEQTMCDVARLPARGVVSASHVVTDLTLGLGEVVFDYLKDS